MTNKILFACMCMLLPVFMTSPSLAAVDEGVPHRLAILRKSQLSQVAYHLKMNVPADPAHPVEGTAAIQFLWHGNVGDSLLVDFQGKVPHPIRVNGKEMKTDYRHEHIVIPGSLLGRDTQNRVEVAFISNDKALNRNADYMYSLFVPDHARSVFPCFDQPDIKAHFSLTLSIPSGWTAISNAPLIRQETPGSLHGTICHFGESDLLPTYLFSFAAGKFTIATKRIGAHEMSILHRETAPEKIAQIDTIFHLADLALRWMEDYTGIPQPFQKYGLVVLPGYQFGGMEHPGCIQLRDQTIFLGENATIDERLNRLHLIAHETAHLWFGDLVTMRWFDDVWTKEVFANFMADKIAREQFPGINHDINFLKSHYLLALSTDRTEGTHPIQQPLDNLNQAGLLYGNIIYHKAPIMMRQLEATMGTDAFQQGLRTYLSTFSFGNATWDDLIDILDKKSPQSHLKAFDGQWVKRKGLSDVSVHPQDGMFDPMAYGRYMIGKEDWTWLLDHWQTLPETHRYAAMIYLYDHYLRHPSKANADAVFNSLAKGVTLQDNSLVLSTCNTILLDLLPDLSTDLLPDAEQRIISIANGHPDKSMRRRLLQGITRMAVSPDAISMIARIWEQGDLSLFTDRDYMAMSYHLAILMPSECDRILATQRQRLRHADLIKEFDFVSRGCTADTTLQRQLFESLLKKENRAIEPYAAALLSLLNDPLREPFSNQYIIPALDVLEEIQQTGDIFFPLDWCRALLDGHRSEKAHLLVGEFLDTHPHFPINLRNKLLQASYRLGVRVANQQSRP